MWLVTVSRRWKNQAPAVRLGNRFYLGNQPIDHLKMANAVSRHNNKMLGLVKNT